jgi:hypothetical protein
VNNDYIPTADADLLAWSANFSSKLTAAPTSYGQVAGDATAYATLHTAFATALTASSNPSTRTQSTVATKSTARASLVQSARALVGRIQSYPALTDTQRADLGITVYDGSQSPLPAPATLPIVSVATIAPGSHGLRIVDELTPSSRSKPFGTAGCEIYVKRGTTPPASINDCAFVGLQTRNQATVNHSSADNGKTAYYLGRWINKKGQPGPVSLVVSATIAA